MDFFSNLLGFATGFWYNASNMGHMDTQIGGGQGQFPRTTWSMVSGLQKADPEQRRTAIEKLSRRYWKPVYRYLRIAWAKKNEEAKDITQTFFVWLMEGETLQKYTPEKGTFRAFVKGVLRCFLADYHKGLRRLKRGGGVQIVPLDDLNNMVKQSLVDSQAEDPERAFDAEWKNEVFQSALERTRAHFSKKPSDKRFRVFEIYYLGPEDDKPSYKQMAADLELKESDIANYLFAVRERLRTEVEVELAETVSDQEELQSEYKALFDL